MRQTTRKSSLDLMLGSRSLLTRSSAWFGLGCALISSLLAFLLFFLASTSILVSFLFISGPIIAIAAFAFIFLTALGIIGSVAVSNPSLM